VEEALQVLRLVRLESEEMKNLRDRDTGRLHLPDDLGASAWLIVALDVAEEHGFHRCACL
jgi:hypothetical protein